MSSPAKTLISGPSSRAIRPERAIVGWAILSAICGTGFLLRFLPILLFPDSNQPDEIFQILEQAHRIVFGTGVVPWEFRFGARSYLLPFGIAGLMQLSRFIGNGPEYYLPVVYAVFAALSTACIVVVFLWGKRFFGTVGALAGTGVMALSVDAIFFGPRTSPEVVSAHLFLLGCYVAEPGYLTGAKSRLFLAGALFGVASALRVQLTPPIAAFMLWTIARSWRDRLLPMLIGAAAAAFIAGLPDWIMLGSPFAAIWRNIDFNIFYGVELHFGKGPWYEYPGLFIYYWGPGAAILLLLGIIGIFYLPALGLIGVLIVLEHSFFAHKEFRFVYPAVLCGTVLAAIGMGRLVNWIAGETWLPRAGVACAALLFWTLFSLGEAASWGYGSRWSLDHNELRAALKASTLPSVCGVGLFGVPWWLSGGYTYMNFRGLLYAPGTQNQLAQEAAGFNTLIYRGTLPAHLGYRKAQCFGGVCVATRAGSCRQLPTSLKPEIPRPLKGVKPEGMH